MTLKIKKQLVLVLIGIMVVMIGLFAFTNNQFNSKAISCESVLEQGLKTKYVIGETFQVPSATISYKGSEFNAEKWKVVYPSGKTMTTNRVVLDEAGEYSLTYISKYNGDLLQSEKKLNVVNSVYSVGSNSTVSFGMDERVDNAEGLKVSLAYGDVFKYNLPLNLTGKVKTDKILDFISLPNKQGLADANEVYVKLTDAYDEENYVIVKTWHVELAQGKGAGNAYQSAKSSKQAYTGIQVVSSSKLLYNGEYYSKRVESSTGYESNFSFTAASGYGKRGYSLSMNYAEKEIFGCPQYNSYGGNTIIDLDNSLFFNEFWEGFTTGECYLSVYADSYNTANFNFLITNILSEDLSNTEFDNSDKPEITIEKEDNLYAIVNKPFKLFKATAIDVYSGVIDCDVSVLYNGYANVNVEDGCFTPQREGRYTIKYTAKGLYGAETVESVTVKAVNESLVSVDFGTLPSSIKAGITTAFDIPVVTGTSGEYKINYYAKNVVDSSIAYDLNLQADKYNLTALYSGEYKLCCDVTDANGLTTFDTTINVETGSYALKTEPKTPNYFIKNASYDLGNVSCYDLTSGAPEEKNAEIYYVFDTSAQNKLDGTVLKVLANEQVKILIYCENNLVYEKAVDVIDVGYGTYEVQMHKYFVSEDDSMIFDNELSFNHAGFIAKKEKAQMTFINDVLVQNFTITFRVPECNFKTLKLKLDNGVESLLINFTTNGVSSSVLSFNDKISISCTDSFESGEVYVLTFSNRNNTLMVNNKVYDISKDVFGGFSNVLAKLSFELDNVDTSAKSKLLISKINNQVICSDYTDDFNAPQLYNTIDAGLKTINQVISLSNIMPVDVLAINSFGKITVTNPKNQYVVSEEGVTLKGVDVYGDYKIKLVEYGTYNISISFEDDIGNSSSQSFSIIVKDLVGPEISVNTDSEQVKLNSKFNLREFNVTDNVDSKEDIKTNVIIIAPNSVSYDYDAKKGFTFNQKGIYKIIIFAVDMSSNATQVNYDVIVK